MGMYRTIQSEKDLREAVHSRETWELDFKGFVKVSEWWELAKDIAAFANYLGGVILVGAEELESGLPNLVGLAGEAAGELREAYEKVARDKCLPRPLVNAVLIELSDQPDRWVLAVNVDPVPDQIVGAMHCGRNRLGEPIPSDAWRFPIRIGKDNISIPPDRLSMFIDPKTRRTAIRLSAIPVGATPQLVWRRPSNQSSETPVHEEVSQLAIDLPANIFRARRVMQPQEVIAVPLDDVETVWERTQNQWSIRVTGWLNERSEYITNPSNATFRR